MWSIRNLIPCLPARRVATTEKSSRAGGGDGLRGATMSAEQPTAARTARPVSCFGRIATTLRAVFTGKPHGPSSMHQSAAPMRSAQVQNPGLADLQPRQTAMSRPQARPASTPAPVVAEPALLSEDALARLSGEIQQALRSADGLAMLNTCETLAKTRYADRERLDWNAILFGAGAESGLLPQAVAGNKKNLDDLLSWVPYLAADQLAVPPEFSKSLPAASPRREDDWVTMNGSRGVPNQLARIQLHEVHHLLHQPQPISVSMASIASLLGNGIQNASMSEPKSLPGFGEIDVSRIVDVPDFDLMAFSDAINTALVCNDVKTLDNISKLLLRLPKERLAGQDWQQLLLTESLRSIGLEKAGHNTTKTYWDLKYAPQVGASDRRSVTGSSKYLDLDQSIRDAERFIAQMRAQSRLPNAQNLIREKQAWLEVCKQEYASNRSQLLAAMQPLLDLVPQQLLASASAPRTLDSLTQAQAWKRK